MPPRTCVVKRFLPSVAVFGVALACVGETATTTGVNTVAVATVTVAPATPTVVKDATVQLSATTKDASGNTLTGRTVTWTSGTATAASVNASGMVTGLAAGSSVITATSETRTGTATVTVTLPSAVPVATVSVAPVAPSVAAGATVTLTATTKDASGNTLAGRTVTWTSGTPAVASVDGSGLVSGLAAGTSVITATSETRTGTATVTVTATTTVPDTLFVDRFESGALSDAGRWQDIVGGSGFNIITASSDGITAHGGTKVLKVDGTAGVITHFITPADHLYLSFWVYFTGTSAVRYGMIRGSKDQWGSFGIGTYCPQNANAPPWNQEFFSLNLVTFGGSPAFQLYNYWRGMTPYSNGSCFGRTAEAGTGVPVATYYDPGLVPSTGAWHHVEKELHLNTPGSADGWEKIWFDGVLKIEHIGVVYRTDPATRIQAVSHDFNTPSQTVYLDDQVVRAAR